MGRVFVVDVIEGILVVIGWWEVASAMSGSPVIGSPSFIEIVNIDSVDVVVIIVLAGEVIIVTIFRCFRQLDRSPSSIDR